jgi:Xaa-Pro dipeptidase
MVITVEPGCYFIPTLFTKGAAEWKIPLGNVNMEKVKEYFEMGGVRIEDDIIITKNGCENVMKVCLSDKL